MQLLITRFARAPLAVPLFALGVLGCSALLPSAVPDEQLLDGPIAGLSGAQRAQHLIGDAEFNVGFGMAEGLGPVFVGPSCSSCHIGAGKGNPLFTITRFGRVTAEGFDPMRRQGGPQLQDRAVQRYVAERVPNGASGLARFIAPSVSGLGLLESVDDTTLLALSDPEDANGDGISGRVQLLADSDFLAAVAEPDALAAGAPTSRFTRIDGRRIGRFGRKGAAINLFHQTVTAYHEDMGITSAQLPIDIVNPQVGAFAGDGVADPEISSAVVERVVFYLRTLRPPPRRNADAPEVRQGEARFAEVGCGNCHLPQLTTGTSDLAPLSQVSFAPFTDLLLHDLGPDLDDGYTEGRATTAEWRTTPLWGLGLSADAQGGRAFYLHDGRATSLEGAIGLHGGEAARSRAAFQALPPAERSALLAFLRSL